MASRVKFHVQDYGGKIDSVDEYDEMLDRWGEMLEAGDSAGALEMLGQRLPELPEGDNLEDYLSKVLLFHHRLGLLIHVCKAFRRNVRVPMLQAHLLWPCCDSVRHISARAQLQDHASMCVKC